MTVIDTDYDTRDRKNRWLPAFGRAVSFFLLNLAGLLVALVLALAALGTLATASLVGDLENNASNLASALVWVALIGGGILGWSLAPAVGSWQWNRFRSELVWPPVTFFAVMAIVGWLFVGLVTASSNTHTVAPGEIRITADGSILTAGQSVARNYQEPTSLRVPLTDSGVFDARIPMSDSDWVNVRFTLEWSAVLTPELEAQIRNHPPDLNRDGGNEFYLGQEIVDLLKPEMERLIRAEAAPGQTAVGEAGYWAGRSQASVPMSVRLGLQLEDSPAIRPDWLQSLSIQNVSVDDWNREESAD